MSKPWDKLRKPVEPAKHPIGPGSWGGGDYPQFTITRLSNAYGRVGMTIGGCRESELSFSIEGLKLASEFFAELHEQLQENLRPRP